MFVLFLLVPRVIVWPSFFGPVIPSVFIDSISIQRSDQRLLLHIVTSTIAELTSSSYDDSDVSRR